MDSEQEQDKGKGKETCMDQLTQQCNRISISDEVESGLVVDQGVEEAERDKLKWRLVGRFLTDRTVNFHAMKTTLSTIWRPVKGVYIRAQKPNLFVFKFFHEVDMERVIKGGKWTFDRHVDVARLRRIKENE